MDKAELERLVDDGHSTRRIAWLLCTSQTNVRYWLKKHGLSTVKPTKKPDKCTFCEKRLDPKRRRYTAACGSCYVLIRKLRVKQAAFAYKGGKCAECGRGDGPLDAYDFHHVRTGKKFRISRAHKYSAKKIKEELDKCDLLCAFCHRVEHAVERSDALMEEVNRKVIVY